MSFGGMEAIAASGGDMLFFVDRARNPGGVIVDTAGPSQGSQSRPGARPAGDAQPSVV